VNVDATREFELELLRAGAPIVIGMDEVGRGAIAGPVTVGVCVVSPETVDAPPGLRDSKLLSAPRREALAPIVREWALVACGSASAVEIDELGISACLGLAGKRALIALHELGVRVGEAVVLLDGSHNWLAPALSSPLRVVTRTKADRDCAVVAGASVVAKVERDGVMVALSAEHAGYGWEGNKGYGSAGHFEAVGLLGPTDHHRRTWLHEPAGVGLQHDG